MKRLIFSTLMLLALTQGASAQARVGFQHESAERGFSPGVATGLATLNTVLPIVAGSMLLYKEEAEGLGIALLGWGWVVGPAPFSLYYRDTTPALVGLGIRSGAVLVAAAITSGGTWDEDGSNGTEIALLGVMLASGVTTVLNIIGLPPAVRRYYEGRQLTMSPWVSPNGAGLSVAVRI